MAVGANANAYWLIRRLKAALSALQRTLGPAPLGVSSHLPPGWQVPAPTPGVEMNFVASSGSGLPTRRSSAGSIGSALATALTQATRVAATKAAKRTRIWRSVGRGYWAPLSHVKLAVWRADA